MRVPERRCGVHRIGAGAAPRTIAGTMNLPSSPLLRRLPVAAGAVLLGLLAASPAQAASDRAERLRTDRPGAERALRQAQSHGRWPRRRPRPQPRARRAGRPRRRAVRRGPRGRRASCSRGRPTTGDTGQPGRPVHGRLRGRVHRPLLLPLGRDDQRRARRSTDDDDNGFPDYIEDLADVFEESWTAEHKATADGGLGWREPIMDGDARRLRRGRHRPHRRLRQGHRQARPLRLRVARPGPGHADARTRSRSWTTTTRRASSPSTAATTRSP